MNSRRLCLLLSFLALGFMSACSSSSKKSDEEKAGATAGGLGRFMDKGFDKKKKEFSKDIRSRYDQQTFTADKTIKDRRFDTGNFNGKSNYNGSRDYKAQDFTQADKKSREETHRFEQADKQPRESDRNFTTKGSRLADEKAREGDKSYAQGDEQYKTRMLSDAAKAQKKEQKPLIIPKEGDDGKRAYTEEEVRKMVNRN